MADRRHRIDRGRHDRHGVAATGQFAEVSPDLVREPALEYFTRPTTDVVTRLNADLQRGAAQLAFDDTQGYLPSILDALHLRSESQLLIFSKTSVQSRFVNPRNPRALYFNDAVTVGYIPGADYLEFAAADPEQGVVFYTLDQRRAAQPTIERRDFCPLLPLRQRDARRARPARPQCRRHDQRSHRAAPRELRLGSSQPVRRAVGRPLRHRPPRRHDPSRQRDLREQRRCELGHHRRDDERAVGERSIRRRPLRVAPQRHRRAPRLRSPDADDEPADAHRLGRARRALRRPARMQPRSSPAAAAEVVDYLLFVDETPLPEKITGTSGFAQKFSADGPADRKGRSLRQLDLSTRLLTYPVQLHDLLGGVRRAADPGARRDLPAPLGRAVAARRPARNTRGSRSPTAAPSPRSCATRSRTCPTISSRLRADSSGTHLMNGDVARRAARRPDGKARQPRISGIFEGGATQPAGMHRRPNAGPIYEMGSKPAKRRFRCERL